MTLLSHSPRVPAAGTAAARLRLCGRVQGVGYRPFVFRLAQRLAIAGSVRNLLGEVEVIAEGRASALAEFTDCLIALAPGAAAPRIASREAIAPAGRSDFTILESSAAAHAGICVPPDLFACEDCLRELNDPRDRRHGYAFINCTQCGPRYTLIVALPYDRTNTTMAEFELCDRCRMEYSTPFDRRFHAEPVACVACGPQLSFEETQCVPLTAREALDRTVSLLRAGATVAVKGIGGYHLMCDARSPEAVNALRARKHRLHKPLAVMFPQIGPDGLQLIREHVVLTAALERALISPVRPIVLAARRSDSTLAAQIAPGLGEVGIFLPYSPLHHLLLQAFGGPLVATSGNVSGEPVIIDNARARESLACVADAFLHHNRRIERPADDSVVRVIAGRARVLRLGRGMAPLELELPSCVRNPLLAVGGHMKITVALAWDRRVVVSPHIADMGSVRSERVLTQVIADLQRLYGVEARMVVCDAHPRYATTRWARSCGLPVTSVLHHHAHASALAGEHSAAETALVFTWDGTGFGADGTLWGGEAFFGRPGDWRRVASLHPFRLPGGDAVARRPWRSAAALCWQANIRWEGNRGDDLVRQAWERNVNCSSSSAVGRLFDAAAAIVLGMHDTTFEGQGPMLMEAHAHETASAAQALPLREDETQTLLVDWVPLLATLVDRGISTGDRAAYLHAALAQTIVAVAQRVRARRAFNVVGLTGGVFQNRRLTELATALLHDAGFHVWLHERIPCNDGGLSFGQMVEAAARDVG